MHKWVIALFVVLSLALALPFSQSRTVHAVVQPLTGTYLSEGDDEMSWIKVSEQGKGNVRCQWRKLKLMPDGKVTQQALTFEGKLKGNHLSMQTHITQPKRVIIYAEAVRENDTIRMSLSTAGMTFHTARYNPSGMVDVGFSQSRFVQQGEDIAQAKKDAAAAQIPPQQSAVQEEMKKNLETIRLGNQHIAALGEYRQEYPKTIKAFERNTASVGRHLQQVHGAQKMGQRAYVTQNYMQMQEVLGITYTLQNDQDKFREHIARDIKPFIEQMRQKQESCAQGDEDKDKQSMCKVAAALEKSLSTKIDGIEKIFEEIRASYRKNVELQRKAIDEARPIVNPDAVE